MYFGMFSDPTFLILIPAFILAIFAQSRVGSVYNRYSKIPNRRGITGGEAARRILGTDSDLAMIPVEITPGKLSDHYDPRKKIMRLSPEVHDGASIASVAIAAHEAGHAMQHESRYIPLKLRNAIALPVSIISHASWPLLIIGIIVIQMGYYNSGNLIFNIGVIAFAFVVLFHTITLPVEFNASRRAIRQLKELDIIYEEEAGGARKVLSAAALTYVAALAVAVAQLVRLLLIRGRN